MLPRRPIAGAIVMLLVGSLLVLVAPAPANALARPRVVLSGGPTLVVDINPDLAGSGSWAFRLQKRSTRGSWATVGTYRTLGSTEQRALAVRAGTYRVVVLARPGYAATTSGAIAYVPRPVVRWSAGSALRLDVDPNLPGTGAWTVTLQRRSGASWTTVGTYVTQGTGEGVTALVGSGTYRAVVAARDRFPAFISSSTTYVYDPSVPGSFRVAAPASVAFTRTVLLPQTSLRSVTTTRYLPVAPAGSAPLVVIVASGSVSRSAYAGTATWLAQHGYAVVTMDGGSFLDLDTVRRDDVGAVISNVTTDPAAAVAKDTSVTVVGHGDSGRIAVLTAVTDSRVDALVGLDPVDGGLAVAPGLVGTPAIPMGFLGETLDSTVGIGQACTPAADNYTQFYSGATSAVRAYQWTLAGAGLASFAEGSTVIDSFCQTPTASKATVLAAVRTLVTAFLGRNVRGDLAQDAWLTGSKVGTGPLTIVTEVHRP